MNMSLFFNFTEKSVRRVSFLFAAILCIASSCVKQDDIDNLQKQIDELKSNEIATVQQQMSGIQQSLGNLQTVDTELRGYIVPTGVVTPNSIYRKAISRYDRHYGAKLLQSFMNEDPLCRETICHILPGFLEENDL